MSDLRDLEIQEIAIFAAANMQLARATTPERNTPIKPIKASVSKHPCRCGAHYWCAEGQVDVSRYSGGQTALWPREGMPAERGSPTT